jgi:hypothetical protein
MNACAQMFEYGQALPKAAASFDDYPRAANPPRDLSGPSSCLKQPWITRYMLEVV